MEYDVYFRYANNLIMRGGDYRTQPERLTLK